MIHVERKYTFKLDEAEMRIVLDALIADSISRGGTFTALETLIGEWKQEMRLPYPGVK